jgi:hypothetical protein
MAAAPENREVGESVLKDFFIPGAYRFSLVYIIKILALS